ncbi:MAG: hypothetical protein IPN44_07880 [Flavobacteriales bacterium]|nr:hypothetical protein [Flavobacteriales bacterium]
MPIDKEYIIRLNAFDLGQLLDGLEVRARAWRDTANYLETGEASSPDFVAEECNDTAEAHKLAEHYEWIIALVLEQQTQQDRP